MLSVSVCGAEEHMHLLAVACAIVLYSTMLCGGVLGEQRWRALQLREPIVSQLPARGVNDAVD